MFVFAFMYYTSPVWNIVGCLVAGFGCYGLVAVDDTTTSFAGHYEELGAVTTAIVVQMIIDCLDMAIRKDSARNTVVCNMAKLGMPAKMPKIKVDCCYIVQAFDNFFDIGGKSQEEDRGKVEGMKKFIKASKDLIDNQAVLLAACEEQFTVVQSARPPFKFRLYSNSLDRIKKIIKELEILVLIRDYTQGNQVQEIAETNNKLMREVRDHYKQKVIKCLCISFMALQAALEQKSDATLKIKPGGDAKEKTEISGATMQSMLATRCLHNTLILAEEIEHLCYKEGCFEPIDNKSLEETQDKENKDS